MIRVLEDWNEVGRSMLDVQRRGLPVHPTPQKNWDHALLERTLEDVPLDTPIVDLGCGEGRTLRFLAALGFTNLHGIDLRIGFRLRAFQWRSMWQRRSMTPWFRLCTGDATRTKFTDGQFHVAISVSAIEHGIDTTNFLREAARIVAPGGLLFVTTDYWPTRSVRRKQSAYGCDWIRFDDDRLAELLGVAESCGWRLATPERTGEATEPTVHWNDADYTFLALAWRRSA